MEKLICTACGAPLAPDTSKPFLTCEYCDTAIENKYYVAPVTPEPAPAPEPAPVQDVLPRQEETASGGSLLKTILGVGTAIAASSLRRKSTVVRQPVIHTSPMGRAPQRTHQRALHATPRRHPEPPRTGASGMRPARPGQSRPVGGMRGPGGRGPGRPGGRGR